MVAITALNGALPSSMLTSIGSGFTLRHDAAASYARARAAGAPAGITTAYRTKAQQKALLALYGYPRAEYPGRSQHGEGVALDIPEPARAWFAAHGAAYGWVRTVMPSEPWHFEYVPGKDSASKATPTPTPTEEDPLSALTDEEQRRMLGALDTLATWLPSLKENADRLPAIQSQVDLTRSAVGNATNGIVTLLARAPGAGGVDVKVLADAVADELDRRARERLA